MAKAEEATRVIKDKNPNAQIEVIEMDLGDLKSVKSGAEDFLRREEKLHILINNAGVRIFALCCCFRGISQPLLSPSLELT